MTFLSKTTRHARINGEDIDVNPRETVLQAALRAGIDFPNGCRVGACGACKCKLARGEVRELTETGYLLTAEEIAAGYILACQSTPRTDVELEVELTGERGVPGRVLHQRRLTHDIVALTVQLRGPLDYRAGQFANLSIEGLPGVVRSYSFATPPQADGRVTFTIRRVPGGLFSTLVNEEDVVGRVVRVDGPLGEFWLREADAPVVFVAGGSGLAPILAMLEDAADAGVSRPVTLLVGARRERDLYGLDTIEGLRQRWGADFDFIPVLSEAGDGSGWTGARGLVTESLADHLDTETHAYLCGPPAMVDAGVEILARAGVNRAQIHFDRFTTRADTQATELALDVPPHAAEPAPPARLVHYLKFFAFHIIGLLALAAIVAGGAVATWGLLAVLALYVVGDALLGDDTSTPRFQYPGVLTVQLWGALPLLALIVFGAVWSVAPGDPLSFGALVGQWTGYDALAAKAAAHWGHGVSVFVLTGLMIGMVGTIPAHELTHRTWDKTSLAIGRWMLAFSFDTIFAIEHVYGHHRYVSTERDPATAPRGRNVYHHILASTVEGNVSAWHIEIDRLRKKGHAVWSWRNAVLRGHAMSVLLVAGAWAVGGWRSAAFFVACALWGKALLEIVNYMEHYGMVRNSDTPVQPRHSWNTNRRVSSWAMFNLTRHSHHHAQGEVPYQDLRPYPDAPMMISGYLTTILIAMIPPLWHRLMVPKLLAWDRTYASPEERLLAAEANARSGLRALEAFGPRAEIGVVSESGEAGGGRREPCPGHATSKSDALCRS